MRSRPWQSVRGVSAGRSTGSALTRSNISAFLSAWKLGVALKGRSGPIDQRCDKIATMKGASGRLTYNYVAYPQSFLEHE
jgi:hypothetical protein